MPENWIVLYQIMPVREADGALEEIRREMVECGKIIVCFGEIGLVVKDDFGDALGPGLRRAVAGFLAAGIFGIKYLDERDAEAIGFIRSMAPVTLLDELE